jgi:hypothetical protein
MSERECPCRSCTLRRRVAALPTKRQYAEVIHQNGQARITLSARQSLQYWETPCSHEYRLDQALGIEEVLMHKIRKVAVMLVGAGRWILEDLLGGPGGLRHGR